MDSFTYVVAVFLLAFAMQSNLLWLGLAILIFLLISLRSLSGIILTLITGVSFLILGSSLQGEMLYLSIGLVILAYLVGVKPSEDTQGGMSPDMMAMLQGMGGGGGDPYGGMGGGMGGPGGF
ncbi:MAG: hypothetical protein AABW68_04055 [archaeon]